MNVVEERLEAILKVLNGVIDQSELATALRDKSFDYDLHGKISHLKKNIARLEKAIAYVRTLDTPFDAKLFEILEDISKLA